MSRPETSALGARLNHAAGLDFEVAGGDPRRRRTKLLVTVATVAGAALMLEVLLARVFLFALGSVNAFLAIPIAMYGLALGALWLHWSPRDPSPRTIPVLLPTLLLAILLSFLAFFFLFNEVFGVTHHRAQHPTRDALKTVVLSMVFVPAFAVAGAILATAFRAAAERVGILYATDLVASAAACLLAPVALHWLDLPLVICLLLGVVVAGNVFLFSDRRGLVGGVLVGGLVVLAVLASDQRVFTARPDPARLGAVFSEGSENVEIEELRSRWNEVSRVSLLRFSGHGQTFHKVVHDNGVSNVNVLEYDPFLDAIARPLSSHGLPFLLDERPRSALVLFAGAGHDMILLDAYADGELALTGVEINPRVPWLVSTPPFDRWNLPAFFARDGIELRIDEGRAFMSRDPSRYDLVFVATSGAPETSRTGHARKFLDTTEAGAAYLDHLSDDGLLVFAQHPFRLKPEIFQRHFEARGLAPFRDSFMVLGSSRQLGGPNAAGDTMLIKPSGFSPGERERILEAWEKDAKGWVHYAPGRETNPDHELDAALARWVESPPDAQIVIPTDERPYLRRVAFERLEWAPDPRKLTSLGYASDWVKAFTLIFFVGLALATVLVFAARRRGPAQLPVWLLVYFLGTGIAYMLVQVGLMAKLELFMGRPIYAIAVVLAVFLLANGAGSFWVGRRQARARAPSPFWPAAAAALSVPATLLAVDALVTVALGLPLAAKALLVVLAVGPLAFLLGTFYPLGVGLVVARGQSELVPMTFGLATLSSVVGGTWAMVAVINLGFRGVILQAVPAYALLALLVVVAARRGSGSQG